MPLALTPKSRESKTKMRYRVMHRFWLDLTKDDEDALDEEIVLLKKSRQFTETVRNGIRLMIDLRKGNLDVLFTLFPQLKARFEMNGDDALHAKIDRLESMLQGVEKSSGGGPKTITASSFDLPTFDDDEEEFAQLVTAARDNTDEVISNFLGAVNGLK